MTHILVSGKGGNMGKYDSPENATKKAKCLVALRPNSLEGSGFLVSGTCGRHKCNNWTQL